MKKIPFLNSLRNLTTYLLGKHKNTFIDLSGYNTNLVESSNHLTFKILQGQLTEYTDSNFIFSPISVLLIVSILNYGLGDLNTKTRLDLLGNLNLNCHRHNLHQQTGYLLKNLTNSINKIENTEIDILTILQYADYLKLSYPVENELISNYNLLVRKYDFSNRQQSKDALNETYLSLRYHTRNQLNHFNLRLIPNESSRLNIYSTMYLNTNWLDPFNSLNTYQNKWQSLKRFNQNGKFKRILFMSRNTYANTFTLKEKDLQFVELPFEDNKLSFLIISTTQRYVLAEMLFETKIDEFNQAIKSLTKKYINIHLPRFTIENQLTIQQLIKPLLKTNSIFDCIQSPLKRFSKFNRTCLDFNLLYSKLRIDEQGLNSKDQETGYYGEEKINTIAPKFFVQSRFLWIVKDQLTGMFLLAGFVNSF